LVIPRACQRDVRVSLARRNPVDSQEEINQREWEQRSNWSGWFGSYSSTVDTRLWVPKRPMMGTGQALNFGHAGAKTVVAGMGIIPAALLLVVVLLGILAP
jgi:uncharacterized membrane protein